MLYLWPYLALFSLPLTLPTLLAPVQPCLPTTLRSVLEKNITGAQTQRQPSALSAALFIGFALAAVHLNTIVHPYTLADNRHYVFYVFRILLRHPAVKYLAVGAYYLCAVLVARVLGGPANAPSPPSAAKTQTQTQQQKQKQHRRTGTTSSAVNISFFTIWTLTTALSLVTAPLVEPRYFILPWVMWRLHVPTPPSRASTVRLGLETAWALAVDGAVGYMFLRRGFAWESEPGNVQRFMW